MKRSGLLAALALSLALPAASRAEPAPTVRVEGGALVGAREGDVVAFRGIPYAAAPVGELRWRPPQPAPAWAEARDASRLGPDCVQGRMPGAAPARTSEDCLYLNVWRPADARSRGRLPVLVWIHGGAFVNGGSSSPETEGGALARRGLVVVTFNYRLGRLGFFAHPALTAERPREPKGNYGLMDQIAALQWVRRNIAAFGGDPAKVTLMGESAGGISVNLLLGSPAAQGLFERAIIQSGGGRDVLGRERRLTFDLPGSPSAEHIGLAFAERLGVRGEGAAALQALRALPAEQITGDLSMASLVLAGAQALHAGPIVDGQIVAMTPEAMFKAGRFQRVPLLLGATSADLSLDRAPSAEAAYARFGDTAAKAREAYDPKGVLSVQALNRAIGGDRNMVEPARFVARTAEARGEAVYLYRFGYVPKARKATSPFGADHASDVGFVFDRLEALYPVVTRLDRTVATHMADYWANFARTGDPNGPGLAPWPRYRAGSDQLMLIGPDGSMVAQPDPWRARLDLLEGLQDGK